MSRHCEFLGCPCDNDRCEEGCLEEEKAAWTAAATADLREGLRAYVAELRETKFLRQGSGEWSVTLGIADELERRFLRKGEADGK